MGAVLQQLIPADVAGVLFTRDPITGAAGRVIEASWGLGEVVVDGRVIPDRYRLSSAEVLTDLTMGRKDVAVRPSRGGGRHEQRLDREPAERRCLTDPELTQLHLLAARCEAAFGQCQDIQWAFAGGELHLLQIRPLTAMRR